MTTAHSHASFRQRAFAYAFCVPQVAIEHFSFSHFRVVTRYIFFPSPRTDQTRVLSRSIQGD